jgi:hypothetical protein
MMLAFGPATVQSVAIEYSDQPPLAVELMSVIMLAMTCPNPAVGMEILADGVGVVLAGRRGPPLEHMPTPLRPAELYEPPPDTDSAEYHYAMAERERALREE